MKVDYDFQLKKKKKKKKFFSSQIYDPKALIPCRMKKNSKVRK